VQIVIKVSMLLDILNMKENFMITVKTIESVDFDKLFLFLFRLLSTFIRTERCWLWYWFWNTINRNVKFIFFSQSSGGRNELQVKQRFIFYSCCFSFVINVFLERLFFCSLCLFSVCVCVYSARKKNL